MKTWAPYLGLVFILVLVNTRAATDLRQATVKEVVNDVTVIPANTQTGKAARVNDLLKSPDLIRTGANSRAELLAADETVARVGANTIFSFEQTGRKINLQQGTILFHAPHGRGGGIIQTAAATAAVTGTTIMVSSTRNGGFKVMVLEGKARVQLPGGKRLDLRAGELSFILPGNQNFTAPITFRLGTLVNGSRMVNGFKQELASKNAITKEISNQERYIIGETGIEVGDVATEDSVEVIDDNTKATAVDNEPSFADLIKSDFTISSSTLDPDRLISTGPGKYTGPTDLLSSLDYYGDPLLQPGDLDTPGNFLFAARNLTISASTINLPPAASGGGVALFADQDFSINNPVTFNPSPNTGLLLYANNNFKADVTGGRLTANIGTNNNLTIIARNQLDIFGTPGAIPTVLNTINVPNSTSVNLSARTVVLTWFDFNPSVTYSLLSQTGNWQALPGPGPIIPGWTNLIGAHVGSNPIVLSGSGGPSNVSPIAGTSNVYSLQR